MSFGGGYTGGRTRMGTRVLLNVYDLSPANEYLHSVGLGLHHSGVEILGIEYSFASGSGIFEGTPKEAPGAKFREQIELGGYDGGQADLNRALSDLRDDFGPGDYNLVRKNCNHFANALVWRLLKRQIPAHVNRLAEIGLCCSCLLPRDVIDNSPVGDPNAASRTQGYQQMGGGSRAISAQGSSGSASKKTGTSFSGTGNRLGGGGGNASSGASSSTTGLITTSVGGMLSSVMGNSKPNESPIRQDDLVDRREKARKAALARLERNMQQPKEH